MSKMTIIQLLNKIANGENPKKIKYYDDVYEFDCYEGEWGYVNKEYCRYKWFAKEIDCDLQEQLNNEVEIIEEDKKIEKLEYWVDVRSWVEGEDLKKGLKEQAEFNKNIYFKINEIINVINKGDSNV